MMSQKLKKKHSLYICEVLSRYTSDKISACTICKKFAWKVSHFLENRHFSSEVSARKENSTPFDHDEHSENTVKNVLDKSTRLQCLQDTEPKNIVIDFSSPNIAKPFHVGHLRSTIIGNFIGNINEYYHNNVTKINYLGDWGTQFGLLKYGLQKKQVTMENLKTDPIKMLYDCYVHANKLSQSDPTVLEEARKYFTDIENGKLNLDDWRQIKAYTVCELKSMYERLNVHFTYYHWESDYNCNSIKSVLDQLVLKKIMYEDRDGKKVAKVGDKEIPLLKSDGSTLYLSRDIAALMDRYNKYNFDKHLYVVDNSQKDHFATLFDIASRLDPNVKGKCEFLSFGRVRGMSTRSGKVVFLKDILDEARSKMHQKQMQSPNTRESSRNDATCDVLGTTAVVVNDLRRRRHNDYTFSWDTALQSDGDSGIKLQYLHCRLTSLLNNSATKPASHCDPSYLKEPVVFALVNELANFDDVLRKSYTDYEACVLVSYLFKLSRVTNKAFKELRVKGEPDDVASQRLLLFGACRNVVKSGLEILGVRPLLEM